MELNHLKYFFYVAKEGGFTKAAKALNIAQSAVSKHIKNLENDLNVKLFEISGRDVRLTSWGADLYRKCEVIFEHLHEIETNRRPEAQVIGGSFRFGAVEPIAAYLVPKVLKDLLDRHKGIQPFMVTETATELCHALLKKEIEFVLAFHLPDLPWELEIRKLYPMPFRLVVASNKFESSSVCSTFIGSREVDDTSTKTYPTLKRLQKKFPKASIKISANSLSAHKQLVALGLGVSILPEFIVQNELERGEFKSLLTEESFSFAMKLVCRKSEALSPAAQSFLEILFKTLEENK